MVRKLQGRIVVLPSKTLNGDYIPGVVEIHPPRGTSNLADRFPDRYSFLPEHLGPDLDDLFEAGKIKLPTAVDITVDEGPGKYNVVKRSSIRKRD